MKVALAQVNPTVGDLRGNAALVAEWAARAREAGAQLAVFPELCLTGYPAEDLYLKPHFVRASAEALRGLAGDASAHAMLLSEMTGYLRGYFARRLGRGAACGWRWRSRPAARRR